MSTFVLLLTTVSIHSFSPTFHRPVLFSPSHHLLGLFTISVVFFFSFYPRGLTPFPSLSIGSDKCPYHSRHFSSVFVRAFFSTSIRHFISSLLNLSLLQSLSFCLLYLMPNSLFHASLCSVL